MRFTERTKSALIRVLLAAILASVFGGCAVEETEAVSNLPWNRPQRWEGQGMMGPMMQNQ
jgi:hypothetical protein